MDGDLELVIGTTSGKIYALSGKTGQDTGAFPFETRGRVMAPVRMKITSRLWWRRRLSSWSKAARAFAA